MDFEQRQLKLVTVLSVILFAIVIGLYTWTELRKLSLECIDYGFHHGRIEIWVDDLNVDKYCVMNELYRVHVDELRVYYGNGIN